MFHPPHFVIEIFSKIQQSLEHFVVYFCVAAAQTTAVTYISLHMCYHRPVLQPGPLSVL